MSALEKQRKMGAAEAALNVLQSWGTFQLPLHKSLPVSWLTKAAFPKLRKQLEPSLEEDETVVQRTHFRARHPDKKLLQRHGLRPLWSKVMKSTSRQ